MTTYAERRRIMVDTQVRPSDVTKFPIIEAMLATPRELYLPDSLREAAYIGGNINIAPGRVLLEPRTLAKMLDALDIRDNDMVLDIGCAWGYSTALIARLAQVAVGVEEIPEMAAEAPSLLAEDGLDNAAIVEGPLSEGAPPHAPFDVIIVQGAIEDLPATLADQLKEGGRIACLFQQGSLGTVRIGIRTGGAISWRFAFNAGAPVLPGFKTAHAFAL
jgi:protein-L-isoaspartate(D-aspartate) O-methyltransferase